MGMAEAIEELRARRVRALAMGGEDKVRRQRDRGKGTARERIAMLLDPGSFLEYGQLASHVSPIGYAQTADEVTPADGVIIGTGTIDGGHVCVAAEDFTVHGGTYGLNHGRKKHRIADLALRERLPVIWLQDGAGARAQEMIGEGLPEASHLLTLARLSGIAPQVAIVMGPSAGDSALLSSLAEFIIMVEGTAMLAAAGPPVVKSATGQSVSPEDLGGAGVHCRISGVADNAASTEDAAIDMARRFLSYFPQNAYAYPERLACDDPADRMDERLMSIIPENPRLPYDMKELILGVVDRGSFFEIKPDFARMIVTGLARLGGHSVGIIANQPMVSAGAITAQAANKARHFVDLCSAYHIPIIFLQDVPGVMPGPKAEQEGTLRAGLALSYAIAWSAVPRITVVVRKAFGFGAVAMGGAEAEQSMILAWPTADFGSLPPGGSVLAAHAREIEAAEDPQALVRALTANYARCAGPFHAASKLNIDDVIDPRETRPRLIRVLDQTLARRTAPAQPALRHGVMP